LRAIPLKKQEGGEEMTFLSEGVKSPYPREVLKILVFVLRGKKLQIFVESVCKYEGGLEMLGVSRKKMRNMWGPEIYSPPQFLMIFLILRGYNIIMEVSHLYNINMPYMYLRFLLFRAQGYFTIIFGLRRSICIVGHHKCFGIQKNIDFPLFS